MKHARLVAAAGAIAALTATLAFGTEPTGIRVGPRRIQLVGFTQATFTGDAAPFQRTRACQIEFSNSRMCQSDEVRKTFRIPETLIGQAWVQTNESDPNIALINSCYEWTFGGREVSGMSVGQDGRLLPRPCDMSLSVACCALEPIAAIGTADVNGDDLVDMLDVSIIRRVLAGLAG